MIPPRILGFISSDSDFHRLDFSQNDYNQRRVRTESDRGVSGIDHGTVRLELLLAAGPRLDGGSLVVTVLAGL